MKRITLIPVLLATALGATACTDLVAPFVSTRIEIVGPDYAYGEYSEFRALRNDPAYVCEYRVTVRATEFSSESGGSVRFSGAEIVTYDGMNVLDRYTLSADAVSGILGSSVRPGYDRLSREFDVPGSLPEFRWKMTVAYYDTETGRTDEASFTSRCTVREG